MNDIIDDENDEESSESYEAQGQNETVKSALMTRRRLEDMLEEKRLRAFLTDYYD